ncbi:MAG: amidase family protein [Erysipelotrichaceae bacterium]
MRIADWKALDLKDRIALIEANTKIAKDKLNAVVSTYDMSKELERLQSIDSNAPLYGIPVVLKDNISTKGMRTTASSRILDNYVPVYDACVVEKLKKAGAIFSVKASMDELGMGGTNLNAYTGKVNNPWDLDRISGGSSGGSAVMVASDCAPVALGTDTGDSIRKPAAYNGVVGLKPTYGRISRYGVIPYASSLDHVGLMSNNVLDSAKTLEVLAGRDDRDLTSSFKPVPVYSEHINKDIKGKRIAIIDNVQNAIDDKDIKEQFNELIEKLKKRGAIVEHISFPEDLMNALLSTYFIIANSEATANHSNLDGIRFGMREAGESVEEVMIATRTKGFSSAVRKRFVIGSYSLFVENQDKLFRKAQKVRRLVVEELKKVLDQYDVTIASAAGSIAPHQDDNFDDKLSSAYLVAENHMLLGNFSGYPSITIPSGFVNEMPIGINLNAKPWDEQTLFDIATCIEEETGLAGLVKKVDA